MSFLQDLPPEVDKRTYFLVENSNRSLHILLTNIVGVASTLISILLVHLIVNHSKRERRLMKVISLMQNSCLYFAQIHWGVTARVIILLPFPSAYCIGFLEKTMSTFWLGVIFFSLFAFFSLLLFIEIMIRLRAVSRPGRFFYFKNSTHILIIILFAILIYIPTFYLYSSLNQTPETAARFVHQYYPNCLEVLEHPRFMIWTNAFFLRLFLLAASIYLTSGGAFYLFFCVGIIYELRQQESTMSSSTLKYHVKVFKDTITLNFSRGVFLIIPPGLFTIFAFVAPEADTIVLITLVSASFSAAPIPCTIVNFVQKKNYRLFFRSKFMFWKCEDNSVGNSANNRRVQFVI